MSKAPKIVERMEAAATLADVTVAIAKRAKALGCPAFKAGNRIDWKELKEWCKDNADKLTISGSDLSLKDQKTNEEVRKLRRVNDVADEKLMLVAAHQSEIREMANAAMGVLYPRIDALAVATAGQTAVYNHAILTAWVDEAVGKLSRGESK